MAEAAGQDTRYYCHFCNAYFELTSASFTCPFCSHGFVEEVPDEVALEDADISEAEEEQRIVIRYVELSDSPITHDATLRTSEDSRAIESSSNYSSHVRPNIQNFINDVITNLGVGVNLGIQNITQSASILETHPWRQGSLNAVVRQIMTHMENPGPYPLPDSLIDSLPIVQVEEEQVTTKLHCSICWELFILNENVKQLPCSHIYHEECIRPWLQLHATCPNCRYELGQHEHPDEEIEFNADLFEGEGQFEDPDDVEPQNEPSYSDEMDLPPC